MKFECESAGIGEGEVLIGVDECDGEEHIDGKDCAGDCGLEADDEHDRGDDFADEDEGGERGGESGFCEHLRDECGAVDEFSDPVWEDECGGGDTQDGGGVEFECKV